MKLVWLRAHIGLAAVELADHVAAPGRRGSPDDDDGPFSDPETQAVRDLP
jgi:hypothetical protein